MIIHLSRENLPSVHLQYILVQDLFLQGFGLVIHRTQILDRLYKAQNLMLCIPAMSLSDKSMSNSDLSIPHQPPEWETHSLEDHESIAEYLQSIGDVEHGNLDGHIDVDQLENENHYLRETNTDLVSQNSDLQAQITSSQGKISLFNTRIGELYRRVGQQDRSIEVLNQMLMDGDGDERVEELVAENGVLTERNQELIWTRQDLQKKVSKLTKLVEQGKLHTCRQELKMTVEWWMIRDELRENQRLKKELEQIKAENKKLWEEIEILKSR